MYVPVEDDRFFKILLNIHLEIMFNIIGGRPGSLGLNLLIRNSGEIINLGSKATVTVNAGVRHSEYLQLCIH